MIRCTIRTYTCTQGWVKRGSVSDERARFGNNEPTWERERVCASGACGIREEYVCQGALVGLRPLRARVIASCRYIAAVSAYSRALPCEYVMEVEGLKRWMSFGEAFWTSWLWVLVFFYGVCVFFFCASEWKGNRSRRRNDKWNLVKDEIFSMKNFVILKWIYIYNFVWKVSKRKNNTCERGNETIMNVYSVFLNNIACCLHWYRICVFLFACELVNKYNLSLMISIRSTVYIIHRQTLRWSNIYITIFY